VAISSRGEDTIAATLLRSFWRTVRLRSRDRIVVERLPRRPFRASRRFSRALAGGALVSLGLLVFAVALWLVVKVIPEHLASTDGIKDPSKRAEDIGRTRTAVLASLAGVLATIGAYYTHRTFGLNRQGQITERFTRAVDQLGNPSLDIRLGGIYALERVARESRDDHGPITEILTAYVREHTQPRDPEAPENEANPSKINKSVATDVQATLTVLGRRTLAHDPPQPWHVDLAGAHLEGANLTDAHLEGATFDYAHLERDSEAGWISRRPGL